MVSNITSLPSFLTTGLSPRREGVAGTPERAEQAGDRDAVSVDLSRLAHRDDVTSARDDVADARGALDLALGVGRVVRGALSDIRDLALRAADPAAPDDIRIAQDGQFRSAVQSLSQRIDNEIAGGASLLGGGTLQVRADPDTNESVTIDGVDLRVRSAPVGTETVVLPLNASIATREAATGAAQAADVSLSRLDTQLRRLDGENARLGGHDQLLGALDAALGAAVTPDLSADGARLLALQVKQDLSQTAAPLVSAKASSILAHFRD